MSTSSPWDKVFRIPKSVIPEHYNLYLKPDIKTETFSGRVEILLSIMEDQSYLAIHQKALNVSVEQFVLLSSEKEPLNVQIKDAFPAPKNEFFVILPEQGLFSAGKYELFLSFSGNLKHADIVGFYSSQYKDKDGKIRKLVTSKFEPTYARRAFPCFDEPAKKATFTVSLVQPNADALATEPTWSALSNMNEEGSSVNEPEKGFTTVRFKKSVKMSTYLACFIVSEFGHKKDTITNTGGTDVTLRTFAPAHLTDYTEFALEAAKSITEFYVIYFGIPYRLPKLDLIAIPDFVSGAMEHWGLITFRESNMIVDPSKSSAANQQRVGQVVAHELAHMWFGNLVTMKWWDDLWLNEGFASYIEYKGLDQHKPEMRVLDQFLLDDMQPVLALDAQLSSHPVIQHVEHPDQITEIFDTITYSKGSAVLRMLENFLTPDVFRSGVTDYLKSFEYENAETRDLWASLQKASNASGQKIDVARVMDTWTLQMGLPVITVKFDSVSKTAILSQSRFLATPEETAPSKQNQKNTESPFGYKWDVPITYRTNSISEPSKTLSWLNMEDDSVKIQFDPQTKWIKINADQYGFYRVNYDENMWKSLTANYVIGEIKSPLDRSALIDDAFSLAEGMLLNYTIALNFAEALKKEIDYIPWRTATTRFQQITPLVRGKLANQKYKSFLQYISSELYSTYGWTEHENDDHIKRRMRTTILSHACSAGLTDCLQKAGEEFEKWIIDETVVISPNLRPLVYGYGMEEIGNSEKWKIVFDRYLKETDAQERSRLLVALAAVKDPSILETFVQLAWDENNVRGQDYFSVLQNIADNPIGTPIIWDYVRSKWTMLVERFTLNNRYLGQMIPRITKNFATPLKRKEMELFFEAYPEAGAGESSRAQALERVDANIKWVAQHYPVIADWLEKWTPE